jgi:hypothetical protein
MAKWGRLKRCCTSVPRLFVTACWRPDTSGPLDSRGRLSPHEYWWQGRGVGWMESKGDS